MNRSSIFFSISFIFVIAAASIFAAFLYLLKYDKNRYAEILNNKYTIVSRITLQNMIKYSDDTTKFKKKLKEYDMKLIENDKKFLNIITNSEVLQTINSKIGSSSILYYNNSNYLYIIGPTKIILIKDKAYQPFRYHIIKLIFAIIFFILLITFIMTIKKLKPIKKIKTEIDKFADGDLDINCKMDSIDEISEVANAFSHAVGEIKKLNNSRKLFLRNIMHELKTPITKGIISVEMLEDGRQKDRLKSVFQRLDNLLNEFISIEQIAAGDKLLKKRIYRLVDIVDDAIDKSMINKENIEVEIMDDLQLKVDFKLFSIAIKNMIDNGYKYSENHKIQIKASFEKIEFINKGKKLKEDLSYYIEPFVQGENENGNGFGLGLYIVDSILKAHNIIFSYNYNNGYSIFKFQKIQPIL